MSTKLGQNQGKCEPLDLEFAWKQEDEDPEEILEVEEEEEEEQEKRHSLVSR